MSSSLPPAIRALRERTGVVSSSLEMRESQRWWMFGLGWPRSLGQARFSHAGATAFGLCLDGTDEAWEGRRRDQGGEAKVMMEFDWNLASSSSKSPLSSVMVFFKVNEEGEWEWGCLYAAAGRLVLAPSTSPFIPQCSPPWSHPPFPLVQCVLLCAPSHGLNPQTHILSSLSRIGSCPCPLVWSCMVFPFLPSFGCMGVA